jgi:hypothetical protein
MNRKELKKTLDEMNINPVTYNLEGVDTSDCYVLSKEVDGFWSVYCTERGILRYKKIFENESEACEHLLELVLNDSTTILSKS